MIADAPLGAIWMIAAETAPLAEVGGLGAVLGALPVALARSGLCVRRFLPAYGGVDRTGFSPAEPDVTVPLGERALSVRLRSRDDSAGLTTTLLECDELYARPGVYGEGGTDYADNALRFAVLARAVCSAAARASDPPRILHAHDWHAGAVPLLARLGRAGTPRPRTVFTVHNLPYQGLFEPSAMHWLGLTAGEQAQVFRPFDGAEFHGAFSFVKAGLAYADRITTVSPTHARELQTPEHGVGLDGLLRARAADVRGILNGLDYDAWDPGRDPALPVGYDAATAESGKRAAAAVLRRSLELSAEPRPIAAVLGRLVAQKGVDLVIDALPGLLALGFDLAVLGTGEPDLAAQLERARASRPDRIGLRLGYDRALARLLLAGSDVLLMPSRYEPCGLTQLQAMRYGTVVIAHETGGLCDTIRDADRTPDGTGFLFRPASGEQLVRGAARALAVRARPAAWRALRARAMQARFGWQSAAEAYARLYRELAAEVA